MKKFIGGVLATGIWFLLYHLIPLVHLIWGTVVVGLVVFIFWIIDWATPRIWK